MVQKALQEMELDMLTDRGVETSSEKDDGRINASWEAGPTNVYMVATLKSETY